MELAGVLPIIVLIGSVLAVIVTIVAGREYPYEFALPIVLLTGSAAVWSFSYGLGFYARSATAHAGLGAASWLGAIGVLLGLLAIACRFAGWDLRVNRGWLVVVLVVPTITVLLLATSPFHDVLWRSIDVTEIAGLAIADVAHGPWYSVHFAWTYAVLGAGFLIVLVTALNAAATVRAQAAVLILVGGAPFWLDLGAVAGFELVPGVDPAPVLVSATSAFVGMTVLVGNPIAFRPVTRERLVEELRDGVVVLGAAGRVREYNAVAREILVDHDVNLAHPEQLPDRLRDSGEHLEAVVDGEERRFRIEAHEISDTLGEAAGGLVYYYDVTAVVRREQRISVLHRVLRHNIRNEMTVLLGHLDYVDRSIDPDLQDEVDAVERSAERIMGFAEHARLIERSLQEDDHDILIDIDASAREAVDTIAYRHDPSAVDITVEPDGDAHFVSAVDRELLLGALIELIDNAVVHGGSDVEVRIEGRQDWVDVEIRDDGPGVPEAEIEALQTPVETSLEHASGLGLWVARWAAELSGGTLRFDRENGTNVVAMRLPLADRESTSET